MRWPHLLLAPILLAVVAYGQDSLAVADTSRALQTSVTVPAAAVLVDSLAAPASAAQAVVGINPEGATSTAPLASTIHNSALKRLMPVAILAFTGDGIAAKDLSAITSRFETELLATDSFQVVERRNIDKILREQGFQQSGACDNSECSVEIGKLLSVQGIFTGEVSKVGKTWSLSVKRTDVGSGETQFSHVLDIQGSLEDVLRGGCPEMALIASGRKKSENNHTVLVAQSSGSIWPWIAGGVVVVGGATAAILFLTKSSGSSQQTNSTPDQVVVGW